MNRSWEGKGTYRNFEIKPGLHRSCATRWPRIGLKNLRQLLNESCFPRVHISAMSFYCLLAPETFPLTLITLWLTWFWFSTVKAMVQIYNNKIFQSCDAIVVLL